MTTSINHASLRSFAVFTRDQAGKGQTLAALTEDYNDSAMHLGFDFLMIAKPGRVAKLVELMNHVISKLDAMPEYAERVPDTTPERRAEHQEHANLLIGILRSHGIDPQDWDASLDYLLSGTHATLTPRYWVKIYVDYVYEIGYHLEIADKRRVLAVDLDAVRITAVNPEDAPTAKVLQDVVNHGIGAFSADLAAGHTIHHALERIVLGAPPCDMADALRYALQPGGTFETQDIELTIPSLSVPPVGFVQQMGRAMRADFRSFTDQEARAAFNYQDKCKFNKFPRGKCAKRMLTLGWHFNED